MRSRLPEPPQPQTRDSPPPLEPAAASLAESTPPRFTIYNIFIGSEGLRAGWSLLIFAAIFVVLLSVAGFLLLRNQSQLPTIPKGPLPWQVVSQQEGSTLLCVLIATWLMAKIERRPATAYGYSPQHSARYFLAGLAWGVALLSLLVFGLRTAGLLVFDARILFGGSIVRYGMIWLGGFLLVGLLEETLSRGYLQFTLTRGFGGVYRLLVAPERANALGFWSAAFLVSFIFGFGHRTNPGESPLGLLSAGLAGFLFCFSLWRTGSLWWAIGFHTSWDWAQSFLYGVPDSGLMAQGHLFATHPVGRPYLSGGLTGPEGSILLLPVMAAGVAAVILTLPRSHSGYKRANAPQTTLH